MLMFPKNTHIFKNQVKFEGLLNFMSPEKNCANLVKKKLLRGKSLLRERRPRRRWTKILSWDGEFRIGRCQWYSDS